MNYLEHYNRLCLSRKIINGNERQKGFELHHIVPKCLNGTNNLENLVFLTSKEHYIAHLLLTKVYPENSSINYAFWMMNNRIFAKTSGRLYESLKEKFLRFRSEITFSDESRKLISDSAKKMWANVEFKENQIANRTGKCHNKQHNNKGVPHGPRNESYSVWCKGLTKETDERIALLAEKISKTRTGVKVGPNSTEARDVKKNAALSRIERYGPPFNGGGTNAWKEDTWDKIRAKGYRKIKQKICPHCGINGGGGNMTRYHFDNCKHRKDD